MLKIILAGTIAVTMFVVVNAQQSGLVTYPEGYRNWQHIKSMVIHPEHPLANPFQGIHHIYANDLAQQGLQSGEFMDGAVLVFDLLAYQEGEHALTEGERKLIGVMQKDRRQFAATGGWGFEGFAGDSRDQRLTSDGGQGCFGCHTQRTEQDFVFTTLRK